MAYNTRRVKRKDANHDEIKKHLAQIPGAYVQDTSATDLGYDLLVAYQGQLVPLEIKDSEKLPKKFWGMSPSEQIEYVKGLLTENEAKQKENLSYAKVRVRLVWDFESALRAINFRGAY